MSIQDYANLATIAGNVGVVVALIFAVRQLKISAAQANEGHAANRFQLWMGLQTQAIEFYKFISSPENVDLYNRGRENPTSLQPQELNRFFYLCVAWFTLQENIFEAAKTGHLPDEYFEGWTRAFDEDLRDLGFQWFWRKEGHLFDSKFQTRVNQIVQYANAGKQP